MKSSASNDEAGEAFAAGESSARPDSTAAKLSKEAINELPLFHYSGRISIVRDNEDLERALERISREKVLGFDTETRPSFNKGKTYAPSLVQLAGEDEVFLFHLKWMSFGEELIRIFEDPGIIKTGVAVHDDMRFLARIAPFAPCGVVDLSEVARHNRVDNRGLRGLVAAFLGLRISKGEQCSNWGSAELSARQIRYAATDAWASRAVYLRMLETGLDFDLESPIIRRKPSFSVGRRRPRRQARIAR